MPAAHNTSVAIDDVRKSGIAHSCNGLARRCRYDHEICCCSGYSDISVDTAAIASPGPPVLKPDALPRGCQHAAVAKCLGHRAAVGGQRTGRIIIPCNRRQSPRSSPSTRCAYSFGAEKYPIPRRLSPVSNAHCAGASCPHRSRYPLMRDEFDEVICRGLSVNHRESLSPCPGEYLVLTMNLLAGGASRCGAAVRSGHESPLPGEDGSPTVSATIDRIDGIFLTLLLTAVRCAENRHGPVCRAVDPFAGGPR